MAGRVTVPVYGSIGRPAPVGKAEGPPQPRLRSAPLNSTQQPVNHIQTCSATAKSALTIHVACRPTNSPADRSTSTWTRAQTGAGLYL